jgi:hypothetical protein
LTGMTLPPRDALVSALVNDAAALVAALADPDLAEPAASAVALLALVAGQDVEPAAGRTGGTGGGGSPARSLRTASSPPSTRRPGTPASLPGPAATGSGPMWPPTRRPGSSPMRS